MLMGIVSLCALSGLVISMPIIAVKRRVFTF